MLDLFLSLDSPSGTCFILESIALLKSSMEWNGERLHLLRTAYAPNG